MASTSKPDLGKTTSTTQAHRSPNIMHQTQKEDNLLEKTAVLLSIILAIITFPLSLLFIFTALTKDSLTVSVDAVVFYKIFDPILAIISVTDYKISTHYMAATTLRNALGTRKLTEVLANRPAVSHQVFEFMKNITRNWGIDIVRVEIKDISLPLQLQKAMAAEAKSTRLANAKIIVAKAEIESTKSLQLATEILMDNPMCMQLRYLQSLQTIAGEKTHTIVFPFSQDLTKL